MNLHEFRRCTIFAALFLAGLLTSLSAQAQNDDPYRSTKAIDAANSRAQREAERMVSLSADRIISILNDEPGLLLECKRLLVRTAFEEGRVLDPQDLDDEVLFRLVHQDVNIRVMFTREIENRSYVRAKPNQRDLQDHPPERAQKSNSLYTQNGLGKPQNQEGVYWSQHGKNDLQPGDGAPLPSIPAPEPSPSAPAVDPRRLLLQAQAQPGGGESGGFSGDIGGLPRISPDQLSALIDAKIGTGNGASALLGDATSPLGRGLDGASLLGGISGLSGMGVGIGPSVDPYAIGNELPAPKSTPAPAPSNSGDSKQPALRHRTNPYADVPSLYDLYAQYPSHSPTLTRFGSEIFQNGTGNFDALPMDVPAGPEYVLGPGDGLNIDLFGGVAQRLRRVVSREGTIALPDVGAMQVAGRSLGDVQHMVQSVLRTQYRDVQTDVSLTNLRSIRVYVVGDVQRPGAYDISSLSTPLNAVYQAGGPTSQGSLRVLRHFRGKQLVQQVDVYELLLHGVNSTVQRLESGDTIMVPPMGPEVTVQGMVRRPAIYELKDEMNLAEILQLAGGVLPSGTLRHVDVERLQAHQSRTMLRLDIPENNNDLSVAKALEDFNIQDGDQIRIFPILPFTDKTVYLDGHVFRPGKYAYREGMKVTDLIKSYSDLLPEPFKQHAEVIRLQAPDFAPEVLAFNLGDALAGREQDLVLKPYDTVRVFGRYDFEDPPVITVTGAVRDPGDHVTNGATYLRDAIFLAGSTTPEARLDDAQVFRKSSDGKIEVLSVNLRKALGGDPKDNILLAPGDRVLIHKDLNKADPPTVTVQGEVARPGRYPLGDDMTAASLVRLAGGFKRSAYTEQADLTRYTVEQGERVIGDHQTVPIAKALAGEPDTDVRLHDGDVLTIRQLAGWSDLGATIEVKGEVLHPGTYGIQEGERLSSIIRRAGGFRSDAYPYGAVFERAQIRELEAKNRSDLIQRVQSEAAEVKIVPGMDADQQMTAQAAVLQFRSTLEKLQNTPPAGRLVIHVSTKIERWANSAADIQVRAGDSIYIPKKPSVVIVDGAVYNPTGITFKPGKSAGWYLRQAGGPTSLANQKSMFVIRADGAVAGGSGGLFSGGVESAEMQPGDMLVVPEKTFSISNKWKTVLDSAQLAYAVGIAIQVAKTF